MFLAIDVEEKTLLGTMKFLNCTKCVWPKRVASVSECGAALWTWMKSAIEQMQKKPHKVRLLLLANQAQFSFWKLENRMPTAGTLKLVYILERQLNKYGSPALLEYLKILHAEAICQGFGGFDQVVKEGACS